MTTTEHAIFRMLYQQACFGAGADVRRAARASMQAMLNEAGDTLRDAFERNNLDMSAYFATRPLEA